MTRGRREGSLAVVTRSRRDGRGCLRSLLMTVTCQSLPDTKFSNSIVDDVSSVGRGLEATEDAEMVTWRASRCRRARLERGRSKVVP